MDKTDQEYLKSCLDQTTELRKQINKTIQSNIQMSKNCFEKLEHLKEMARGLHIEATQLLNMIVINNKEVNKNDVVEKMRCFNFLNKSFKRQIKEEEKDNELDKINTENSIESFDKIYEKILSLDYSSKEICSVQLSKSDKNSSIQIEKRIVNTILSESTNKYKRSSLLSRKHASRSKSIAHIETNEINDSECLKNVFNTRFKKSLEINKENINSNGNEINKTNCTSKEKSLPHCSKNENPKITISSLKENYTNKRIKRPPLQSIGSRDSKRSKSTPVLVKSSYNTRSSKNSTQEKQSFKCYFDNSQSKKLQEKVDILSSIDDNFSVDPEENRKIKEFIQGKEQDAVRNEISSFIKKRDLKQCQVAEMTGVSVGAINSFLNNTSTSNSIHTKSLVYKWYLKYLKNPELYDFLYSFSSKTESKEDTKIKQSKLEKLEVVLRDQILSLIKNYNLKQYQVADMVGVNVVSINSFLNNRYTSNSTKCLIYKWYLKKF